MITSTVSQPDTLPENGKPVSGSTCTAVNGHPLDLLVDATEAVGQPARRFGVIFSDTPGLGPVSRAGALAASWGDWGRAVGLNSISVGMMLVFQR